MNNLILGIIFLLLAAIGAVLKAGLYSKPFIEVKRLAKTSDKADKRTYKLLTYGPSLKVIIWTYLGLTTAAGFVLISRSLALGFSIALVFLFTFILFSLLPLLPSNNLPYRTVLYLSSPLLSKIIYYLHPLINRVISYLSPHIKTTSHSGLYEKQDLIRLLNKQLNQSDNRFSNKEIDSVIKSLNFPDKKVSTVISSKLKIKTVYSDDVIGPVLINEIHESGQAYVLVEDKQTKQIVGSLAFDDLSIKSVGYVSDFMDKNIFFINENDSLLEALSVLVEAKHHALVVVNNFGEYLAVVNTKDILRELLGELKTDEIAKYTSIQSVTSEPTDLQNVEASTQSSEQVIE